MLGKPGVRLVVFIVAVSISSNFEVLYRDSWMVIGELREEEEHEFVGKDLLTFELEFEFRFLGFRCFTGCCGVVIFVLVGKCEAGTLAGIITGAGCIGENEIELLYICV